MTNHLAQETSPYLLQHQDNPVDWYAWGPEAIERAKREDKPIFLSIGYSACHWCHVMEHESFEDENIARMLNEDFISIKVDREERPDLDQIYMYAVQILTGRGGWPMSVFLTPDLEPFYGGTYWPPTPRMGSPGFDQILHAVSDAWKHRRDQALQGAAQLTKRLQEATTGTASRGELTPELFESAAAALERNFDFTHGGFGGAPKFPHPMDLGVLIRHWRRSQRDALLDMVRLTLDKMAAGGIYDHLGGGFARYSVDERWLVPHFEKMLYDNALLGAAYLEGYQVTGDENYARVVRETLDYVLGDMTDPAGGFYSTEDADSEGEEGKFYVWTRAELDEVLGPDAAETFAYVYDVTVEGNFEGKNILNQPKTISQCARIKDRDESDLRRELDESRRKLLDRRNQRVRPSRDDKVIVSWNGLMIDTMARAASVLGEPRYLEAATHAANFILKQLRRADGRLLHTWRGGEAKLDAYLDDYAALINALVSVYEAGFDERLIDEAVQLADTMLELFLDIDKGGFFYTAKDHEPLIARTKELHDSSVPSASALASTALLRLGTLCGRPNYVEAAVETLQTTAGIMREQPASAGQMLLALDMYLGPMREIVILAGSNQSQSDELVAELHRRLIPNKVVSVRPAGSKPAQSTALDRIFVGKEPIGDQPTVFICQNFVCQSPISAKQEILAAWDQLYSSRST